MNKLFVGIDVSSQNNVSYLMDSDGVKYSSFSVQNNLGGAKLLTEKIVSAMETLKFSDGVSGMESTSIYGNHLVHSLWEGGTLGRCQRKIHVLNPKQISKFKEAYYDLKYHEVNKGQHKRALALTARKLVRLVFRLLKDNRLYNRW